MMTTWLKTSVLCLVLGSLHTHGMSIREELMLTDDQQTIFDTFKTKAAPLLTGAADWMKTELALMKYFRAGKLNVDASLNLLKDNMKWRIEQDWTSLTDADKTSFNTSFPYEVVMGKNGNPVLLVHSEKWDISVVTNGDDASKKKALLWIYSLFDTIYKDSFQNLDKRKSNGVILIGDNNEIDVAKWFCASCMAVFQDFMKQLPIRWPGVLDGINVINVNALMIPYANLVKGVLPPEVAQRVNIYDDDDSKWLSVIQGILTDEQIPEWMFIKSWIGKTRSKPQGRSISKKRRKVMKEVSEEVNDRKK